MEAGLVVRFHCKGFDVWIGVRIDYGKKNQQIFISESGRLTTSGIDAAKAV